jgi:hypothetical protein
VAAEVEDVIFFAASFRKGDAMSPLFLMFQQFFLDAKIQVINLLSNN